MVNGSFRRAFVSCGVKAGGGGVGGEWRGGEAVQKGGDAFSCLRL